MTAKPIAPEPNSTMGIGSAPVEASAGAEVPPDDAARSRDHPVFPVGLELVPGTVVAVAPVAPDCADDEVEPDDAVEMASASSSEATFRPAVTSAGVAGAAPRTQIVGLPGGTEDVPDELGELGRLCRRPGPTSGPPDSSRPSGSCCTAAALVGWGLNVTRLVLGSRVMPLPVSAAAAAFSVGPTKVGGPYPHSRWPRWGRSTGCPQGDPAHTADSGKASCAPPSLGDSAPQVLR